MSNIENAEKTKNAQYMGILKYIYENQKPTSVSFFAASQAGVWCALHALF